ncbi:MAG: hypothetical protein AAFV80_11985 [Bacteroidota bacterium]
MADQSLHNLLVKYVYSEASLAEAVVVEAAIQKEWTVREEYQALKKAKKALPAVSFDPPKSAIDTILKYSQSTAKDLETSF